MTELDPDWLIDHYGMAPLAIEGTYLVNTYCSAALTAENRHAGTAIVGLFSCDPPSRSLFHRVAHDEIWHFYAGDALRLVLLHPDGSTQSVELGTDLRNGQRVQFVVPGGTWQAGELVEGGRWALFGCTMAPGFSGEYFESGFTAPLLERYPDRADDIGRLGVPADEAPTLPDGYV